MYKYLFALFLFCFFTLFALAGPVAKHPAKKAPLVLKADTSQVQVRNFNERKIAGYLQDKDFRYNKADVKGESLWDRFWHWFWHWFYDKTMGTDKSQQVFNYLLLSIGVIFLIFLIIRMNGLTISQIFTGQSKKVLIPYEEALENIHEINFDQEIEKAIAQRNYRLAVRLLYLRSLKQLNDAHLIHWQIEKTNSAYLDELTNAEQRQSFGVLTRQFEYVWYGNFFVDGASFQNISALFQDFKRMLP